MDANIAQYEPLFETIKKQALREWIAQGHNMTGKVVEELEFVVKKMADSTMIEIWMLPYGKYQDTGVPANKIPYSRGSGAGKSAYIDALTSWASARMGLSGKAAKSAAFAIAETHKKEGMPSKGAMTYSNNGHRTEWFTRTMQESEPLVYEKLYNIVYKVLDIEFTNMINRMKNELVN